MGTDMKVADFTSSGRGRISLRFTHHSAMDLLCTLWVLGDRTCGCEVGEFDIGDEWFAEIDAALSDETKATLAEIGSGNAWIGLIPLLPEAGDGGTVDSFIRYLADMEPAELRYHMMSLYDMVGDVPKDVIADAAEGDAAAVEAVLATPALDTAEMKPWRDTLAYLLAMEPADTQAMIVGLLSDVQATVFAQQEEAFRPMLQADVRSKRAMARRISPERLFEIATAGVHISEDRATKPIVLVPTMVARPWVVIAEAPDFFVFGYPVSEEFIGSDPDAPPQWLVKLHKALGDERRLRLLRTLAQGDASLADLAEQADIAKSTLHHHLMLLRAAGLVRVHVGEDKQYSLRDETLTDAATVLDHYIHATPDAEEDT
jgi:DNA-binding transcriptional ArsR family regulator